MMRFFMKVLMIVDLQNGFMVKDCYVGLIEKIEELLKKCKYDKVIFTKFVNKNDSMYERYLNWSKLKLKNEQEIAIPLPKNSEVREKTGYGLNAEDITRIKAMGVNKVDICGLQTDACIYAIALQLFDNGIFPNILINCTATSQESMEVVKNILIHQFGSVDESVF